MNNVILNSRILIIDDTEANVLLLERILHQAGYQHYKSVTDSRQIIGHVRDFQPDLILLDLMMPHVDGFGVMAQMRQWMPVSEYLPILVITADTSRTAKQKALTLGATDFLTKPIDNVEASLRVYNLLETRWLHREIQAQNKLLLQQNDHLEEVVHLRTRELTEAQQRLAILGEAKNDFLKLISHELRTPLNGLLGTGELILELAESAPNSDELRAMFEHSRQRILSMLDNALLLTQIQVEGEKVTTVPTSLSLALASAIEETSTLARARHVRLQAPQGDVRFVVPGSSLMNNALQAIMETAVKFAQPQETVAITIEESAGEVSVLIQTHSGSLSREAIAGFFDVFTTSEASTSAGDLGLGPAVAHRIMSLFGGSVAIANREPSGIELRVVYKRLNRAPASLAQYMA